MRILRCATVLVAVGVGAPAAAQDINSAYVIDSGCVQKGATGWYKLSNTQPQQVLTVDTNTDGIPESVYCAGGSSNAVSGLGTSTCGNVTSIAIDLTPNDGSGTNCAFAFDVWLGNVNANTGDCSLSLVPVMMFGGDGDDDLDGSEFGDLLHGGDADDLLSGHDGNDTLCPGPADDGSPTQTASGGNGSDILWGGVDPDVLAGNADADLVTGAPGPDTVTCGTGNDSCLGDAGSDDVDAGAQADLVQAGGVGNADSDTTDGGDGDDHMISQNSRPDTVDGGATGGAGTNTCYFDSGVTGDTLTNCTLANQNPRLPCTTISPLFVATHDAAPLAWITELDVDGTQLSAPANVLVGLSFATAVVALAVDPNGCVVNAVAVVGGVQKLVTLTVPQVGNVYSTTLLGDVPGNDWVGMAFGHGSIRYALQANAQIKSVVWTAPNNVTETNQGSVGRPGATGVALTFDAPDSSQLFAYTIREGATCTYPYEECEYDVDAYDAWTDHWRLVESDVDWDSGPIPYTWSQTPAPAGIALEIDDTLTVGSGFPMWKRQRPSWGGETGGITAWTAGCGGLQCFADLPAKPDAIGSPHFGI